MSQPFFSIIVPAFKTEAFLEQCLESIKAQTFTNFECLLINDGSIGVDQVAFQEFQDKDYKPKIDFSKITKTRQVEYIFNQVVGADSRFKLLIKPNSGVSSARNTGLLHSAGKWIVQIDPDDWVLNSHLQVFYDAITLYHGQKMPVAKFVLQEFYNTRTPLQIYTPKKITLANIIHSSTFTVVTTAYNLDLINRHKLSFDIRLGRGADPKTRISEGGEDFLFAYQYLEAVEKELGKNGFEVLDIPAMTYKYREIFVDQKKITDDTGPINYAKYFQQFGFQNSSLNIKIITFIFPFWTKLRYFQNPLATLLRKIISLSMRLISGCY